MPTATERLYNIALRPTDPATDRLFVEAAQAYAATEDGYLLGPEALPHVTLCMFRTASREIAATAFASWNAERTLTVTLGRFRVVPASDKHGQVWWTQIDVARSTALIALQLDCYDHLTGQGFDPLQKPQTYKPHFTFTRRRTDFAAQENPAGLPEGKLIQCRAEIGECTDIGVFIRPLI